MTIRQGTFKNRASWLLSLVTGIFFLAMPLLCSLHWNYVLHVLHSSMLKMSFLTLTILEFAAIGALLTATKLRETYVWSRFVLEDGKLQQLLFGRSVEIDFGSDFDVCYIAGLDRKDQIKSKRGFHLEITQGENQITIYPPDLTPWIPTERLPAKLQAKWNVYQLDDRVIRFDQKSPLTRKSESDVESFECWRWVSTIMTLASLQLTLSGFTEPHGRFFTHMTDGVALLVYCAIKLNPMQGWKAYRLDPHIIRSVKYAK